MSAPHLGNYNEDDTVHFLWNTSDVGGASVKRSTDGTVSVYKDLGASQSTAGVTDDDEFDGLAGVQSCIIVLTDAFYVTGADYAVVLSASTLDGQTVNAVVAAFSIENRVVVAVTGGGTRRQRQLSSFVRTTKKRRKARRGRRC